MKDNIVCSIIIVNFNRIDLTIDCINSIYKFCTTDFEIIVIDNNSTTCYIDEVIDKYPSVVLIKNKENKGFSYANNQGLKIAKGEYILFLNNDTLLIEDTLEKVINYYKSLKRPALIGCKLLNADNTHQASVTEFETVLNVFGDISFLYLILKNNKYINRFHLNYKNIKKPIKVGVVKGAFIFGEKKYISDLSGFDDRFFFYGEENDLCKRFNDQVGDVIYFPESAIIHLGGATTANMPWFSIKNLNIGRIQLFQKHFKGVEFGLIITIHYLGIVIRIPIYFISGVVTFNSNLIKKAYNYLKLLFIYPKNRFK